MKIVGRYTRGIEGLRAIVEVEVPGRIDCPEGCDTVPCLHVRHTNRHPRTAREVALDTLNGR